jgi:hypothetical protein
MKVDSGLCQPAVIPIHRESSFRLLLFSLAHYLWRELVRRIIHEDPKHTNLTNQGFKLMLMDIFSRV